MPEEKSKPLTGQVIEDSDATGLGQSLKDAMGECSAIALNSSEQISKARRYALEYTEIQTLRRSSEVLRVLESLQPLPERSTKKRKKGAPKVKDPFEERRTLHNELRALARIGMMCASLRLAQVAQERTKFGMFVPADSPSTKPVDQGYVRPMVNPIDWEQRAQELVNRPSATEKKQ